MINLLDKTIEFFSNVNDDGLKRTTDVFINCPMVSYNDGIMTIFDVGGEESKKL